MGIISIIIYIILLFIGYLFYSLIFKPKVRLLLLKKKYKDAVYTFFYPIIGDGKILLEENIKNPAKEILLKHI